MIVLVVFALFVGALLPVQAGLNAQLRQPLGHPVLAALTSFAVGTLALTIAALSARASLPPTAGLGRIPWWQWTGGLIGATYVLGAVVLAPRLGAATLTAAIVAGQLAASLALDHFGWVGFPEHAVNPWRIVGAALVVVGVILVQRH